MRIVGPIQFWRSCVIIFYFICFSGGCVIFFILIFFERLRDFSQRERERKRLRNFSPKKNKFLNKNKIMQLLQNCIGPTIRIGREIQCLPYAGFLVI